MSKTILVVDDIYSNRYLIEEIFSEYKVYGVSSGNELREFLKEFTPDIILMDINLPDEDGYEIVKKMKNRRETMHIPVIFITVHNTRFDVLRAVKAGGIDFITKPFDQSDLRERVERVLWRKNPDSGTKAPAPVITLYAAARSRRFPEDGTDK